eukprot:CAMPEP_0119038922 /NCGR_PEP_ID=MMETSP1177-20130426/8117_1 /TAXON_ID=2985 /ORGANISM="Ochromonas sp, Strain CCMP1899" /LENGTH=221 /DNA_ID=CAMNT_0007002119 /DNA_START=419 /DNA_END=1084 /DNA_ORIENTATION=-
MKIVAYVLESLSSVNSCVIPVTLDEKGVPGAESLVNSLFDALISGFNPEYTEDVTSYMCSILEACLEEYDLIGQDLLDVLLAPLLPPSQAENSMAYDCVIKVVRNTSACIQTSINAFMNHVLMGTALPGRAKTSRLTDHIYPLLSELHKIHPGFLLFVSPSICVQSGVEGEDICFNPLKVLRDLFFSDHTNCTTEFSIDLQNLLDRFNDLSGVIRLSKGDK